MAQIIISLKGEVTIISKILRKEKLDQDHDYHQRLQSFTQQARHCWWWPPRNNNIENMWQNCPKCGAVRPNPSFEPRNLSVNMASLPAIAIVIVDQCHYCGTSYIVGVKRGLQFLWGLRSTIIGKL